MVRLILRIVALVNSVLIGDFLKAQGNCSEGEREADRDDFVGDVVAVVSSGFDPGTLVTLEQTKLIVGRRLLKLLSEVEITIRTHVSEPV